MSEANMRQELINLLDGKYPEIAKAHYVILRRMNRDANDGLVPCSCVSELGEPDKDNWCPSCWGHGYLWTEEWIKTFSRLESNVDSTNSFLNRILPPGIFSVPAMIFYAKWDANIRRNDRIIEVSLDNAGSIVEPIVRRHIYKVVYPYLYRADNGKAEYFKIFTHEEDMKYRNSPSYG